MLAGQLPRSRVRRRAWSTSSRERRFSTLRTRSERERRHRTGCAADAQCAVPDRFPEFRTESASAPSFNGATAAPAAGRALSVDFVVRLDRIRRRRELFSLRRRHLQRTEPFSFLFVTVSNVHQLFPLTCSFLFPSTFSVPSSLLKHM